MIIEMRFSNIYSIKDEVCIDFKAGKISSTKTRALQDNVFKMNNLTLLKTQGLFGANASGKSSIIKAAHFYRDLIITSDKYNDGDVFSYEPFKFDGFTQKPSTFFVDFIEDGIEYEYSFSITRERILTEELYYYPNGRKAKIFTRDETQSSEKKEMYSFADGKFARPMDIALSTGKNTLFISRASQMDRELAKKIYNYFRTHLFIGLPKLTDDYAVTLFEENKEVILRALKLADSDINNIEYRIEPTFSNLLKQLLPELNMPVVKMNRPRFYTTHDKDADTTFSLVSEESTGTIQIFNLLLILLDVCKNNKTLFLDEFDINFHNELALFVINLVHASNSSQFLFTSHKTNLMNLEIFRRDQIIFVNKKDDGSSETYSLLDFTDFNENMDAEKFYLQGHFDAVPYINSSLPTIKGLLNG